jgi:hypothetical protein
VGTAREIMQIGSNGKDAPLPTLQHDQDEVREFKLHPPDPIGFMESID